MFVIISIACSQIKNLQVQGAVYFNQAFTGSGDKQ
jgi:hypothetical protein